MEEVLLACGQEKRGKYVMDKSRGEGNNELHNKIC